MRLHAIREHLTSSAIVKAAVQPGQQSSPPALMTLSSPNVSAHLPCHCYQGGGISAWLRPNNRRHIYMLLVNFTPAMPAPMTMTAPLLADAASILAWMEAATPQLM